LAPILVCGFFMSLDSAVAVAALALACLAFCLFWYFAVSQLNAAKQAKASVDNAVAKTEAVAVPDVAKLLENAAKLIDSIAKAGPGLSALGASVLFLAIAAYTVSKPEVPPNSKMEGTATANPKPVATDTTKPGASAK
jgi:hypothetical protein